MINIYYFSGALIQKFLTDEEWMIEAFNEMNWFIYLFAYRMLISGEDDISLNQLQWDVCSQA